MTDTVDAKTRSRMMSAIKAGNTSPELAMRSLLHRAGFRFRLHSTTLPGKPDIVLPKHKVVIFVHGCFWHCHQCRNFRWPGSNIDFWQTKLRANMLRDSNRVLELVSLGWRVLVIWECLFRGQKDSVRTPVCRAFQAWLKSGAVASQISPSNRGVS
jgi:DNA mismatch endonuclease, patch repair protein